MSPLYYLQDSRQYVGNDMLWWAKAGGYTTDLSKAETYDRYEVQRMHNNRSTDIPWSKEYIDTKVRPAVDMQYVKRKEAGDGGIVFTKPAKERKEGYRCHSCQSFISETNVYLGECTRCGANNHP